MIPTRRLVGLAFAATAVAFAAGFASGVDPAWLGLDALVAAGAAADALLGRRPRLAVTRAAADIFSVGRPNPVTLTLTNLGERPLAGTVTDDPLPDARTVGLPGHFTLGPHESKVLRYEIVPERRGRRALGGVTARYALPLGLLARQERFELPHTVDVYPDVHAARALELLRRQGREDARLGSLRVRGGDTEFERLRPYQRGDEQRHVDWRASARREDLVARQFQAESNQNVVFALDIGRGMRGETLVPDAGGEPRPIGSVDQALAAALLTADVALRGGDRAGLLAFDDQPRSFLAPTGGRAGGRKLTRAVYALEPSLAATDYRSAMVYLKSQVKARSLLVLFTNLLDPRSARDLATAVKSLVPRHLPLCVLLRDPGIERLATSPADRDEDLYVRAAAAESLAWRDGIVRTLRHAGALVLDARPEDITPLLVQRYLEIKARRLL